MIKKHHIKKANEKLVVPVIDLILGRTMSKKLMVFLIASGYLMAQYLTSQEWVTVAEWYIGGQAAVDVTETIVQKFKHKRTKTNDGNETENESEEAR